MKKLEKTRTLARGTRVEIPACVLEYREGGNTLWIHSPKGATILRLKVHTIESSFCESSSVSHADMVVAQDLQFCLGPDASVF